MYVNGHDMTYSSCLQIHCYVVMV